LAIVARASLFRFVCSVPLELAVQDMSLRIAAACKKARMV
jgi:hypothetical protein